MTRLAPLLAVLFVGCFVSNPAEFEDCSDDSDCPAGQSCVSGFCIVGDAGDASVDAEVDDDMGQADMGPETCTQTPSICDENEECCFGECVTFGSGANCGGCGVTCTAGESCCGPDGGRCVPAGDEACDCPVGCGATEMCCAGTCTEVMNDVNNCGGCEVTCDPGQLCCSGGCVANDANNCGACGEICDPSEICCGAAGCKDPTAPGSCGSCGNVCVDSFCVNGTCCGDQAGEMNCDGSCVNTNDNDNHCGGCGVRCTGLEGCVSGECRLLGG